MLVTCTAKRKISMDAAALDLEIQVVFYILFSKTFYTANYFVLQLTSQSQSICLFVHQSLMNIHTFDTNWDGGSSICERDNSGTDSSKESNEIVDARKSVSTVHFYLHMIVIKRFRS